MPARKSTARYKLRCMVRPFRGERGLSAHRCAERFCLPDRGACRARLIRPLAGRSMPALGEGATPPPRRLGAYWTHDGLLVVPKLLLSQSLLSQAGLSSWPSKTALPRALLAWTVLNVAPSWRYIPEPRLPVTVLA